MAKRKKVSKKKRFEVFKRDNFTCQYCGKEAPDVILELDHIKPVAEGGSNDVMNLITSCFDCNRGKGARELNDDSVIKKQKRQLEEINKRREQLEMMVEWREQLRNLDQDKAEAAAEYWYEVTNQKFSLNEYGIKQALNLVKKFKMTEIFDAMDKAAEVYFKYEDGELTKESVEKGLDKLGGIIVNERQFKEKPYMKKIFYIRGILRNRFRYIDNQKALKYLILAYENTDVSLEYLEERAKEWNHWTHFKNEILDLLDGEGD